MRRFLVLNSLLLLAISVLAQMSITADTEEAGVDIREYNVLMQVRGREMTGICVMQTEADSSIVGTMITEMGVKIFDFTYSNGKAKVMNVIAPLNKWYIRKVLRQDMEFMIAKGEAMRKKSKREFVQMQDGSFKVNNNRYKIYYTFTPMCEKKQ